MQYRHIMLGGCLHHSTYIISIHVVVCNVYTYVTGFWKTVPITHFYLVIFITNNIAYSKIFHNTTWNSMLKLLRNILKILRNIIKYMQKYTGFHV